MNPDVAIPKEWMTEEFHADLKQLEESLLLKRNPDTNEFVGRLDEETKELPDRIQRLIQKYGAHPDLLEHLGYASLDVQISRRCFERALIEATKYRMPTTGISLALADCLASHYFDYENAKRLLESAKNELDRQNEPDREWVHDLHTQLSTIEALKEGGVCECGQELIDLKDPCCPCCGAPT